MSTRGIYGSDSGSGAVARQPAREPAPPMARTAKTIVDADDLPALFVRALYDFGSEVTVWSRSDAVAAANNGPSSRGTGHAANLATTVDEQPCIDLAGRGEYRRSRGRA